MNNTANIAIIMPPIKPKFLEELLGILGAPNQIILRVPNKEYKIDDVTVEDSFIESKCKADNKALIKIYNGIDKKSSIAKLEWYKASKGRIYQSILHAEFTPYQFELSINRNKLSKACNSLLDLIEKYNVPNKLTLLHENKYRIAKIKTN